MVKINTLVACLFICILHQSCTSGGVSPADIVDGNADYTEYTMAVKELSGLCFTKNKASFMAVSDRGIIYEIEITDFKARKLPYSGTNDLEGITMNTATGEIYVVDEAENTVYKLSADEKSLTQVVKIVIPNPVGNKGLEGISYGNDTLYIVNQAQPARLLKYSLSAKTTDFIDVSFATNLSDICFDAYDNTLWIVDSKSKKVFHCDLNANVKAAQSIAYIAQAEAIAIDRQSDYMWIGCDTSSKIYKVKIKI